MSTQLQHNSPTLGWVACDAKVRCRYEHRSVEVSENISEHQEAIEAAAADGVIDADERAALGRKIADSIFNKTSPVQPPEDRLVPELEPQSALPEIPRANRALETYNIDLGNARKTYDKAVAKANAIYADLQREHKTLENSTRGLRSNPSYIKPDYLKRNSSGSPEIEARLAEENEADFRRAVASDAKRNKENQAQARAKIPELIRQYEEAKNVALEHKRVYDENREAEGSAISLQGVPKEYLTVKANDNPSQDLSVYSYNIFVHSLKRNEKLSVEEKKRNVEHLRTKMISSAISKREEQLNPSLKAQAEDKINKIFSRKTNSPSITDNQKQAQGSGPNLAKFAREFQSAPWDTLIGE